MIRTLRAFTWLRWRLVMNSLRGGERRDTLERVSRVASLVLPGLMLASAVSSVAIALILGFLGGWLSVTRFMDYTWVLPALRIVLLMATVFIVLIPLFVGIQGGAGRFTRMLLLPIPRRTLHFVEVFSSLTDPWLAFVLPGLVAFAGGLIAAAFMGGEAWHQRRAFDGVVALVAGLGVVFVLTSLGSLVAFVVSWFVRDRRRSEVFVLVLIVGLSCLSIIPAFFSSELDGRSPDQLRDQIRSSGGLPRVSVAVPEAAPTWAMVLPSELYFQSVSLARQWPRPTPEAVWPIGALYLEGAILYLLSAAVHRKRMESVEIGRSVRKRTTPAASRSIRIPGFWPGTSAVALAQARTALRSVRGQLVVLLPGPLVAMMALLFRGMRSPGSVESLMASRGYLAFGAGILFCLYAAQAITMNQFGSDRAGLTLQFLAPIRDVDLVRGKAVGCAMMIAPGVLVSLVCALGAVPGGSPFLWLATLVGGVATFLILAPVAAWVSAILPVAADLSKTGGGGNPHNFAMLAGTVLVGVAAAPVALIMVVFPPLAAFAVMTVWMIVAGLIANALLAVVARTVKSRRENLALVAQGR